MLLLVAVVEQYNDTGLKRVSLIYYNLFLCKYRPSVIRRYTVTVYGLGTLGLLRRSHHGLVVTSPETLKSRKKEMDERPECQW